MTKHSPRSIEDWLYVIGWWVPLVGGVLLLFYVKLILPETTIRGCIWDRSFGFYCPGCGGTRAVYALLKGHLLQSLWYHPIVPYAAVLFISFMVSQTFARLTKFCFGKGMRFHNWYLYGAVVIIISNFILKNLLRLVWNITM